MEHCPEIKSRLIMENKAKSLQVNLSPEVNGAMQLLKKFCEMAKANPLPVLNAKITVRELLYELKEIDNRVKAVYNENKPWIIEKVKINPREDFLFSPFLDRKYSLMTLVQMRDVEEREIKESLIIYAKRTAEDNEKIFLKPDPCTQIEPKPLRRRILVDAHKKKKGLLTNQQVRALAFQYGYDEKGMENLYREIKDDIT
jgi:hypothetical protein